MLCSEGIRLITVSVGPAGKPFWPLAEGLKLLVPLYCSVSTCKGELASAIATHLGPEKPLDLMYQPTSCSARLQDNLRIRS